MKEKYDHRLLLKHLPADLRVFLEHIQVCEILMFFYMFQKTSYFYSIWLCDI